MAAIRETQAYWQQLSAYRRRHDTLLALFDGFFRNASLLAASGYPVAGITVTQDSPISFTARFVDREVNFTLRYRHEPSSGVVEVRDVSVGTDPSKQPIWSFQFNGQGVVADIDARVSEGSYNVGVDTDAAEIVLAAIYKTVDPAA